eukprot:8954545-Pyramimonas_sp.AAC.1
MDPPRFDLQDDKKTFGTPAEAQHERPGTAGASQKTIESSHPERLDEGGGAGEKCNFDLLLPPTDLEGDGPVSVILKIVRDLLVIHFGSQSVRPYLSLRNELMWLWQARPGGLQLEG